MRWDAIFQAIMTRAAGDALLAGVFGTDIGMAGTQEFKVPNLTYMLVSSGESELWAPHTIQFDQWTNTMADLAISERSLHRLFSHDTPQLIEGIYMWAVFEQSVSLTGPAREGFFGQASRFIFTPIREKLLSGR